MSAALIDDRRRHIGEHRNELALLERAIDLEPSTLIREGGVIAQGYDAELDELRAKLIGLVNAPATKIAQVVTAPAAKVARVFAAYADKAA